jgi:branched-chain amino acid transport system substrate-binding protein
LRWQRSELADEQGGKMSLRAGRRKFLAGSATAAASLCLPAVGQGRPVRIGLLTVKTGPLAQGGIQMEQGIALFLKHRGNKLAGRTAELIVADTGGNPAGAKTKAQELIERDHVDFIVGPLAAFELLAISDYAAQHKCPILSLAAAEDMSQRKPNPYFVRASGTSAQSMHPLADYARTELKYDTVITVANDFAFGYEEVGGFQRVFEDAGGRVKAKLWPPLVTPDYTPFLGQMSGVDAVVSGLGGSNPIKFMRQFKDHGLTLPVLGGSVAMDDGLLKSFGDEAIGVISCSQYTADLDTPSNQRFVADSIRDYGGIPGSYAAGLYTNGQVAEAALEQAGGRTDDKEALIKAMRAVSLSDSPRGPFHFDRFGNVVGDFFIRRCVRKDGKLVNTTVKTYRAVSQFWTYDESWFLSQPVYSRDYPPLKT